MVEKVKLRQEKSMYYVLSPISSDPAEEGSLKTCFLYGNGDQESSLEKAREFANIRAIELTTTVEETL